MEQPGNENILIRRRQSEGTIKRNQRIARWWRCKSSGSTVEVVRYMNVVGVIYERRIIFRDPDIQAGAQELSMEETEFRKLHEPCAIQSGHV